MNIHQFNLQKKQIYACFNNMRVDSILMMQVKTDSTKYAKFLRIMCFVITIIIRQGKNTNKPK